MDESTSNYINALIGREQTNAREKFINHTDGLITRFAISGMAFSTNHMILQSKAAGAAIMDAVRNLCGMISDRQLPIESLDSTAEMADALFDEFQSSSLKFFHVTNAETVAPRRQTIHDNRSIIEGVFGEERKKIDQEIAIARFEHSTIASSASDAPGTAPSASPANPIALSAIVPTGFFKLPDCYIEVFEAVYAAIGTPSPSSEFDQEYADADFRLRNSISQSVQEYFRRSIQAAWQHPPLALWTRGATGVAPEVLNPDRLAATNSVSWPNSIKSGLLIVHSDPALLRFDRWPLYVAKSDWPSYRTLVLASHLPIKPTKSNLSRLQFEQWVEALPAEDRARTERGLVALCESTFPGKYVPRSWYRPLVRGRKPGKRPLRKN